MKKLLPNVSLIVLLVVPNVGWGQCNNEIEIDSIEDICYLTDVSEMTLLVRK